MTGRSALACALLVGLVACGDEAPAKKRRPAPADDRSLSPAERDAAALGQLLFETIDRAVEYRGAHRGRAARSLRQLGLDSLTPTLVRRLAVEGNDPMVTVAFRRTDGRTIVACQGGSQILEEAAVRGGRFVLQCADTAGSGYSYQVGPFGPP